MTVKNVYEELVIDLVTNCNLNMFQGHMIVDYLRNEGIIDYDALRKYYEQD